MPQDDHPGFEFWGPKDVNHPFPVGEIDMGISTEGGGSASASIVLRPAPEMKRALGTAGRLPSAEP